MIKAFTDADTDQTQEKLEWEKLPVSSYRRQIL